MLKERLRLYPKAERFNIEVVLVGTVTNCGVKLLVYGINSLGKTSQIGGSPHGEVEAQFGNNLLAEDEPQVVEDVKQVAAKA